MIQAIHDPGGFDYFARKELPGGKVALVYPLTYGRARIGIGQSGSPFFDDVW